MKIAFTSCCDPHNDNKQVAWLELVKYNPDVLVLLGDNMYMDYKLGGNPIDLYEPSTFSPLLFSQKMYENYERQWKVENFQTAINSIDNIYAIWDDHDFAWNNSRGEGTPCTCVNTSPCKCGYVPPIKRMISKTLFEQFRSALTTKPLAIQYPANPFQNGIPTGFTGLPYTGIEQTIHLSNTIHLHLLDGRSFRPEPDKTKSLLGLAQQTALQTQLSTAGVTHLIASGTTLENWKTFNDKDWLKGIATNNNIIVLSGDIHKPAMYHRYRIFEFTASAMAQPKRITRIFGRESNVFGILEILDKTINANIYQFKTKKKILEVQISAEIDIESWTLTGVSEKRDDYPDTE